MPWNTTLADALDAVRVHTEQAPQRGLIRDGLATGLEELDRVLGGLRPGGVTVLAGAPSVGLTSFAVSIARHVIRGGRRDVGWASVDVDVPQVAHNFLSSQSLVPTEKLRLGTLSPTERLRCDEAIRSLTRSSRPGQLALHGFEVDCNPLDVVAGRDVQVRDVRAAVVRLPTTSLLVVDDLKRLLSNEEDGNPDRDRHRLDGQVMQDLSGLATTEQLHVLATVRLYRVASRSGEPSPSDFTPFRELYNLADNVVCAWRDDLHDEDSDERGIMRVNLLRSPAGGYWSGRVAHLLDKRLVANLAPR